MREISWKQTFSFTFRVFGLNARAHIACEKRNKLKPNNHCYVVVGYNEVSKAYYLYYPSTHKVIEHRDAIFDEVPTHVLLASFWFILTDDSLIDDSQHV